MSTPRHQFSYIYAEETVCINTSAENLDEILNSFERYLRACGFSFKGEVTICETDTCPHHEPPADLNPTEDGKEGV
jgi:hypothetical protein